MKNGTCPKCSQNTVYSSKKGITFASAGAMYIQNLKGFMIMPLKEYSDYVCTSCGYFETYIDDEDKLGEIANQWSKV
jgi:predicted nucleic-acid-binding Zn-ribbon protein